MADNTVDPGDQAESAGAAGADDENAALIAELEAEQGKTAKPAGKPAAKVAKKAAKVEESAESEDDAEPAEDDAGDSDADEDADETAAEAEDDDADEDLDEEDDEPEEDEDSEGDDELDDDTAKDPALKKRLDAVRRTAERQRQRLEQERTALERDRTAFQTETKELRQAVEQIRGRAARAKIDPIGLLEAHGLTQDDMEYVANLAFARSKSAAAKPEYKAAAERAMRDREAADAAAANAKRIADLEAKLEGKDAQAAADRELDVYFDRVFRKATAEAAPITARLIAKRPKTAREELAVTAARLSQKLGRMPKVAELLAAHEKREVRALRLRGIKPPGAAKPAADASNDTEIAKPAAKRGKPTKPGAKPAKPAADDPDEVTIPSTADLVRELQRGAN